MTETPAPTPKTTRNWTPEQRAEQSRKLRERKIWLKSTGPKTANGKHISAHNAVKHGRFSADRREERALVRSIVRENREFCALVKAYHETGVDWGTTWDGWLCDFDDACDDACDDTCDTEKNIDFLQNELIDPPLSTSIDQTEISGQNTPHEPENATYRHQSDPFFMAGIAERDPSLSIINAPRPSYRNVAAAPSGMVVARNIRGRTDILYPVRAGRADHARRGLRHQRFMGQGFRCSSRTHQTPPAGIGRNNTQTGNRVSRGAIGVRIIDFAATHTHCHHLGVRGNDTRYFIPACQTGHMVSAGNIGADL